MKLALLQIQATGTASTEHVPLQDPNAALLSPPQHRSSHASTGHVQGHEDIPAPQSEPVRYPVDEITQRTTCELVVRQKNISVVVRMRH